MALGSTGSRFRSRRIHRDLVIAGLATAASYTTLLKRNEVQTVVIGSGAGGDTFTLTYDGQTTGSLAHDVSTADLQTALNGLSNLSDVVVTGSPASYTLTFGGAFSYLDVAELTGTGTGCTVTNATTVPGIATADFDLVFTARERGTNGNAITIAYVEGAGTNTLDVTTTGSAISVALATTSGASTSTAAQVKAAIEADTAANALVSVAFSNSVGATVVPRALSATALSGGASWTFGAGSDRLRRVKLPL